MRDARGIVLLFGVVVVAMRCNVMWHAVACIMCRCVAARPVPFRPAAFRCAPTRVCVLVVVAADVML